MDNIILPNEPFGATPVEQLPPHIVYVKVNSKGYIVAVDSSAFLSNVTGWVEIDSGYGDKYSHAYGNYFQESIRTEGRAYRYKLVDGKPVECTAEEIAAQEELLKPKPVPPELTVWDELDAAYQSGINSI